MISWASNIRQPSPAAEARSCRASRQLDRISRRQQSGKLRADLDWTNGNFYWTYRNRVTAERRVKIRSYNPWPYAAAEFAYQSQFAKWGTTRLFGGCLLPVSKHSDLDIYYEHVNNTGLRPNRQVNATGLLRNFYFPPYRN
jgi:ribosomal protein L33